MSGDQTPKPLYASAAGGVIIVIGTVLVVGGIFILALASGAHH
jgi:hypothetical protein